MFLLYINDITISSSLRLFANTDDCVLYRIIKSDQDQHVVSRGQTFFLFAIGVEKKPQ